MKKLMSIFGVILFASTVTLTSCGDATEANETTTVEEVAVCSNTGEVCLEDHSCCAADEEAKACCCGDETCDGSCHGDADAAAEAHGDHGHDHEKEAACCCGDATCDGSCHDAAEEAAE